jgi:surface protein
MRYRLPTLLLALLLLLCVRAAPAQDAALPPEAFVTTWKTTEPGEAITIPTRGGEDAPDYAFTIDWGDGTTETVEGDDPDPSHAYAEAGVHTVAITGAFPHLFLDAADGLVGSGQGDQANAQKLRTVEQWGAIKWASMRATFAGAGQLVVNAPDAPDLSRVTDMSLMFALAATFNQPIGDWDVSSVTNMERMFVGAQAFNQPIGDWDVSSVTTMFGMFAGAIAFDQPLDTWDVSSVVSMEGMFLDAEAFNQPIGDWDVSSVSNMGLMFAGRFTGAAAFNQPIGDWDVSGVTNMSGMFAGAAAFNQPIGDWDVSSVTNMAGMFAGATSFNQPIGGWDVSSVTDMRDMFKGAELSPPNYDALLIGWSRQDVQPGVYFGAGESQYTASEARGRLTGEHGWTIADSGPVLTEAQNIDLPPDAFVTIWVTTEPGEAITLPTRGGAEAPDYAFTIDWGDGTTETVEGDDPDPTHAYAEAGVHTVAITGAFPHLFLDAHRGGRGDEANAQKLRTVEQWGAIEWASMREAFAGAERLVVNATDAPDLSRVTDMSRMFRDAEAFNQPIGDWNVASVTNMEGMFMSARTFNQPIGDWNVASVTDMSSMFKSARAFNQPIGDWDVSSVTDMGGMFYRATAFNQPIGDWDVASVTNMRYMFGGAEAFDQPIGTWDVSSVTTMDDMLMGAELSPPNYDALLIGWSRQDVQPGVPFTAGASQYTPAAAEARQRLTGEHEWQVTDGGPVGAEAD